MKISKYIGHVVLSAGLVLSVISCTDYDDYNSAPSLDESVGASNTLWENISSDPQLTKFAALAQKSNFTNVLNSPRFFTLWAPVDEAFTDSYYNRLLGSDSATIVNHFMQQHMTEYNYPISPALDSMTVVSLNYKHHPFTQQSFDGFAYVDGGINRPSTNGVMHKINGFSEYRINLYENLDSLTGCDLIKTYIQKYDEYYLDVNASVIGPLRDGKQTYLDSVMKKRNPVIADLMKAELQNEDSSYCMVIPNDKAWQEAYDSIKPRYNFIRELDYMDLTKKTLKADDTKATTAKAETAAKTDSLLQDSLTYRNMVSHLTFSESNHYNAPLFGYGAFSATDTIYSTTGTALSSPQTVIDSTVEQIPMSNGVARVVNALPFASHETYSPIITSKEPTQTLLVKKTTIKTVSLDSLASRDTLFSKLSPMFKQILFPRQQRHFSYVTVDSADVPAVTSNPEFDFALKDVRAETYHIYVVVVPRQVEKADAPLKSYALRFYLSWTDADNKQQYDVLPKGKTKKYEIFTSDGTNTANAVYLGDPGRINVIDLGEFTFPVCYYGLDAYPSLMVSHTKNFTASGNQKKYDQYFRIAGVYLVPKAYNDKWSTSENE